MVSFFILFQNEKSVDARKRIEKKLKKSNKTKDIDQNIIEEEMARIIPGTIDKSSLLNKTKKIFSKVISSR